MAKNDRKKKLSSVARQNFPILILASADPSVTRTKNHKLSPAKLKEILTASAARVDRAMEDRKAAMPPIESPEQIFIGPGAAWYR